ncbi:hypothetical protein [Halegenticoccus soli]|uniref:hypothetical protein n=1 Tax=Halegenticoccus soli TaxID=1985678 RepID=UPI0018ED9BE6|nr:hypothetical protein [Halegenticoccus soli]
MAETLYPAAQTMFSCKLVDDFHGWVTGSRIVNTRPSGANDRSLFDYRVVVNTATAERRAR